MKSRIIAISVALTGLFALASCRSEQEMPYQGEPYFRIDVIETLTGEGSTESDVTLATLEEQVRFDLDESGDAYSAARNASGHVRKAVRFKVSSNLRWKVVPADYEAASWVHPFPDNGDKDGMFFFKSSRNISREESREAFFNVLVDKGAGFEPLEGMIRVLQSPSSDFLELSAAKLSVTAQEQNVRLRVLSNVDWTYELVPMEELGTEDVAWIVSQKEHEATKQVDTLVLRVAANETGIRGAQVVVHYAIDGRPQSDIVSITQYPAEEVDLPGFPVKWEVQVTPNTFSTSWPASGTADPVSGSGIIRYVRGEAGKNADVDNVFAFTLHENSPRVTGVWPDDYCEFIANAPVSAGTVIKLAFATRSSAQGAKYWRMEFRDGETWRPAGKVLTNEAVPGPDGQPVRYTHAMNADGATNVQVEAVAVYKNNTDRVEFRFICASAMRASEAGLMSKPTTATWRISAKDAVNTTAFQPEISCIAAGAEVLVPANLEVSASYLSFNGTSPKARTVTISSDQPLTVSASEPWIHADVEELEAGENMTLTVTVDESRETSVREGTLVIKAGITRRDIAIIQGAAGQDLAPFIGLTGAGRRNVAAYAGSFPVTLQANVDVSVEAADSWVQVSEPVVANDAALVKQLTYTVNYEANDSEAARTATLRFYNEKSGVEAVCLLTQAGKAPDPVYPDGVFFQDDFSWLQPYVDAYLALSPDAKLDPVGSNLASHAQPNIWKEAELASTLGVELEARGYQDLNKAAQVLYMQDGYFKMGATDKHTGLQLPPVKFGDTPVDATLSFDWCAHMTGTGKIDNLTITVEIVEGPGTFTANGTQKSQEISTAQTKGTLAWQHASVALTGVTSETRLQIHPTHYADGAGANQQRWHLDNILIEEVEEPLPPEPPVEAVEFPVEWSFPAPGDAWVKGTDYDVFNPTGSYVYSDNHSGKMTVVRKGSTPSDKNGEKKPTYAKDDTFGADTYRLLHYGMYKDDCWLFEVGSVDNPAGTYTISYQSCSSAAGPKFFALEYSADGGETWTGIDTKTESVTLKTGEDARDVTYTYALSPESNAGNEALSVEESFHLDALRGKLLVRARVADTMKLDTSAEMTSDHHAGTNRIGGAASIAFVKD